MTTLTFDFNVQFRRRGPGSRREMATGQKLPPPVSEHGRIPRVARLMALALRFEEYLRAGQVSHYGELAELGHVTRPRISQIMNLLNLAPDVQEAILFLPRTSNSRDQVHLRLLQPIAAVPDWRKQRTLWKVLISATPCEQSG